LTPTGSVEFYDGSTHLGTGSSLSGTGTTATSTFTTSMLSATSHTIKAVYVPTGPFNTSNNTLMQTVAQATPTITVTDSGGTYSGTTFPAMASIAPINGIADTNDVTFTYTGTTNGNVPYGPTTTAPTDAGNYSVTATVATGGDYTSATSSPATDFTILRANQSINWSAPTAIPFGQPLSAAQLNAMVTVVGPAPAGAVTYTPNFGAILAPGMYTLNVTVAQTDDYNSATATVPLTVLSAAQQATNLITQVNALVDVGVLNKGDGNALTAKLALKGNNGDSGKVGAFIDQVNDFVSAGKLTVLQAAPLLKAADDLLLSLSLS
jgi:hypothetical protein